jgi:hypothetical protein
VSLLDFLVELSPGTQINKEIKYIMLVYLISLLMGGSVPLRGGSVPLRGGSGPFNTEIKYIM